MVGWGLRAADWVGIVKAEKCDSLQPFHVFEAKSCLWCFMMKKTPKLLHLGVFLEDYGHYNFKVLNRKLSIFPIFSKYYVKNFKKAKIVCINVEEDP